jgi:hypothetical protein
MTRTDYIAIAGVLNKYANDLPSGLVFDLSSMLRKDNPQFNPERFGDAVFNKEEK